MSCPSCTKNKTTRTLALRTDDPSFPLNANDIEVVTDGVVRPFQKDDWPTAGHVLLVLIPAAFTPVCATELGALNQWYDQFKQLGCELIAVCADAPEVIAQWVASEPQLASPRYMIFSSYLLPARLGLADGDHAKRASVFLMADGEAVKQEHFAKVGRSFAELHRMLWGYTTGSYCAEGWSSPEDGFLQGSSA